MEFIITCPSQFPDRLEEPPWVSVAVLGSKPMQGRADRKSTRLNSSHLVISYAVFCLKKKITRMNSCYLVISYFVFCLPNNPASAARLCSFHSCVELSRIVSLSSAILFAPAHCRGTVI